MIARGFIIGAEGNRQGISDFLDGCRKPSFPLLLLVLPMSSACPIASCTATLTLTLVTTTTTTIIIAATHTKPMDAAEADKAVYAAGTSVEKFVVADASFMVFTLKLLHILGNTVKVGAVPAVLNVVALVIAAVLTDVVVVCDAAVGPTPMTMTMTMPLPNISIIIVIMKA